MKRSGTFCSNYSNLLVAGVAVLLIRFGSFYKESFQMEKKYIIKILLALINQEIEIIIDNQPGKSYVRDFQVYNLVIRKKTV